MRSVIFILLLHFINFQGLFAQIIVDENTSEPELILGLSEENPVIRGLFAGEVNRRIVTGTYDIKKNNIVEHPAEYWIEKMSKGDKWIRYFEFLKRFDIQVKDKKPNFDDNKYYRLDNIYVLRVKFSKKKDAVKIMSFDYEPRIIEVEPPSSFSGLWRIYDITGTLARETAYENGIKDGVETIYSNDGSVIWSKFYRNGELFEIRNYTRQGILKSKEILDSAARKEWAKQVELESGL